MITRQQIRIENEVLCCEHLQGKLRTPASATGTPSTGDILDVQLDLQQARGLEKANVNKKTAELYLTPDAPSGPRSILSPEDIWMEFRSVMLRLRLAINLCEAGMRCPRL